MKNFLKLFLMTISTLGILGMIGCEEHQERYEIPPWLGGSSIETLEQRGNYTIFLSLMEKSNYKDPISKQLFTLFVPNDEAFNNYFKAIGKNSVDNLTKDEAVLLFTQHVLRNPRSRYQLIYEYAYAEEQGPDGEYASLFHRKPSPSTSIPYKEIVKYSPEFMIGQEVLVYAGNKNIPLFTDEFFHDYGGDSDGSDYLFMYPESTWRKNYTPNLKGMNWHNAQIVPNPEIPNELEVRTSSGFIYFIDRVVPPMLSIEEYMIANPDKYGLFYDIMQRFATYGNKKIDEQKRILYKKNYDLIFNLAEERGTSTKLEVPPLNMWSAFLPSNAILQNYLDNTILNYYSSLDDVPRITLYYILQTHLASTMVIMSKLERGYFNAFGDPLFLNKSDIVSCYMCSNGPIYELKEVLAPNVFTCVPAILFMDKNYSTLLFILDAANMLPSVANPDADVTLFASTNEKLEEYGIRYNATDEVIEFRGPVDGKWRKMNTTDLNIFAQDQIYKGRLSDFSGDGGYVEMISGNYIHYSTNQVAAAENQFTGNLAEVQEIIENEQNGFLIKIDKPIESRVVMGKYIISDPDFSEFVYLLERLKLFDKRYRDPITKENIPNIKFLSGAKYWTGFIPTNEAMAKAREEGIIPIAFPKTRDGKDSLSNFIMYHFVKDDVIFDDGKLSGTFKTNLTYRDEEDGTTILNAKIKIMNITNNLSIQDISGKDVKIEHVSANNLVRKGVVHKINSVLKYYK